MGIDRRSPPPEPLVRTPPCGGLVDPLQLRHVALPHPQHRRGSAVASHRAPPAARRRGGRSARRRARSGRRPRVTTRSRQESLAGLPRRCLDWRHDVPGATGPSRCPCLAPRRARRRGGATAREPRRRQRGPGRGRSRLGRRDRAASTARHGWRPCRYVVAGRSFASRVATARDLSLRVHFEAESGVLQALQWKSPRREGRGVEFLDEIDATIRRAPLQPSCGPTTTSRLARRSTPSAVCASPRSASPKRRGTKWVG